MSLSNTIFSKAKNMIFIEIQNEHRLKKKKTFSLVSERSNRSVTLILKTFEELRLV